jgi:hypothetical protein
MRNGRSDHLSLIAGWCAYVSGVVSLIGIVFLIIMYYGIFTNSFRLVRSGTLNDICVIIQYLLALPITLALYERLKSHGQVLSRAAMLIGIGGLIAVVVLQQLLVSDVLRFEEQIGPVMIGLLVIGIWLVITGYLGRSTGDMPHSLLMSVLAASYIGYPIWAIWLGRLLLSSELPLAERNPSIRGETA